MNTLRRISRHMVKAVAAGAVLVAAALPVVAMTAPAGAATGPSLTCTASGPGCPPNNFVVVGQGFSGTNVIGFFGSGFANDQAVGGVVTVTTTAPGVTFSNVMETASTFAAADINVSSTTTPGFYPVTLTDSGGSTTLTLGLGVDHGPQVTTVAGNVGTAGGASSTVQLTGSFLNGASVYFTGTGTVPTVVPLSYVNDLSGKTLSFTVSNAGTAGAFAMHVKAPWPTPLYGQFLSTYTVNTAPTAVTITSVSPSQLGIPALNPSTNLVTIHGTGFQAGAVMTLTAAPAGVTLNSYTFVNSTTMTATITVLASTVAGQVSIKILNPDTTFVLGTTILGVGQPATNTVAGPPAVVAPEITIMSGALTPGTSTILVVSGSSTFPMTVGSTVKVSLDGSANASETVSGTVLSVDASNSATIQVKLPRYATTTLTAAVTAAVVSPATTTLTVGSTAGMPVAGVVVIYDGLASQEVFYSGKTATTLTGVVAVGPPGTSITTHPVGAGIEFKFPYNLDSVSSTFTLSVNNGTVAETAPVAVNQAVAAAITSANGSPIPNLGTFVNPGSYTFNAYVPGFGFSAGSLIVFNNPAVTGTVTVVNGNTATLHVTVASGVSAPYGSLANAAVPGQNALTIVHQATTLAVGDKVTVNADPFYTTAETFTVTGDVQGITNDVVSVSAPVVYNHSAGATVTRLNAVPSAGAVGAGISNGAGQAIIVPSLFGTVGSFFSIGVVGTATASLSPVGQGASKAAEVFNIVSPANGDTTAANWTVSSTTAGVTFGAVTAATAGAITTTVSVAPGTAVAASVPVTLTNGLVTYTSTIAIVAGPTLTGSTAVPTLTGGATSAFVGVYGTNLVSGMGCSTSDPNVTCAIHITGAPTAGTDTATTRTISFTALAGALNGTDSVTLTDPTTKGAGTLAGAVTVTGQATVASLSPTAIPFGTHPAITLTGTAIPASLTTCSVLATEADGTTIDPAAATCTATQVSATSATITGYSIAFLPGDTLVFTFGNATTLVTTAAVTVYANPAILFLYLSSTISSTKAAQGSTAVPFRLVGSGFLPGTKVAVGANVGTVTVTEVTPNAIFGTLSILATAPVTTLLGTVVTVTNANGGTAASGQFDVVAAPSITSVNPASVLEGIAATLTITGTGFYSGAVVTPANAVLATYGTAATSNVVLGVSTACTVSCNTLTVKINPLTFSGNTPIMTGFTITNPVGAGSVSSSATALSINPVPSVTGTYYVPTFTTNTQVTISGFGFQAGITASSANPDYKVLLVSSSATSVVLLVTTTANATTGTSSVITLTNPDGGSTTFPLNGGPNPTTLTPAPHAVRVIGAVWTGKTTDVAIVGTNFYGQPRITSNAPGTRVGVFSDNGKVLRIHVTVKAGTKRGVHTFMIVFKNGEQTHVKYNQR
jgi:hypothetical protein